MHCSAPQSDRPASRLQVLGQRCLPVIMLLCLTGPGSALGRGTEAGVQQAGAGALRDQPKSGVLGTVAHPPVPAHRTLAMQAQAAPTNQWYSSLVFADTPMPLHAHPATYLPTSGGFEIGYPQRMLVPAGRHGQDVVYPHKAALTIVPDAFAIHDIRLAARGDFSIQVALSGSADDAESGKSRLSATILHASPFSYYTLGAGSVSVKTAPGAQRCDGASAAEILCVSVEGHQFALFGPAGSHWDWPAGQPARLVYAAADTDNAARHFFSVALLPDAQPATVAAFRQHAYAFVTDTHVSWHYDAASSSVDTVFTADTEARQEGQTVPMLGVYLHQMPLVATERLLLEHGFGYDSVRGTIRTVASPTLHLHAVYHGILPFLPGLEQSAHRDDLNSVLVGDAARADGIYARQQGQGTYWYGKALSGSAQLMNVAEQSGNLALRDKLLTSIEKHLEKWLDGQHDGYFVQDRKVGTVIGYPDEYGSVAAMNDHHFHYGYWINSAAQVALRDPAWVGQERWGAMMNKLIADIATTDRGRADFPFLRNVDPYEGHSWASGDGMSPDGNNQESSSEAVNAWAGLILYGTATHDDALRDLGIWLYTTETAAIATYWFDEAGTLFPPQYGKPLAAQVFGDKYCYNTWWTEEPRQIQGINLLPMTPASVYLGHSPAYIEKYFAALPREVDAYHAKGGGDGTPLDIWQDVLAQYRALGNPDAALAQYRRRGDTESGETRSHTLHFLYSLQEMGTPDFSVTANTALYGVFRNAQGQRQYLAYNAGDTALQVSFSDGVVFSVAPHQLARRHSE